MSYQSLRCSRSGSHSESHLGDYRNSTHEYPDKGCDASERPRVVARLFRIDAVSEYPAGLCGELRIDVIDFYSRPPHLCNLRPPPTYPGCV